MKEGDGVIYGGRARAKQQDKTENQVAHEQGMLEVVRKENKKLKLKNTE